MTLFTTLLVLIVERLFKLASTGSSIIGWRRYSVGLRIFRCCARWE
ncbi:Uncharacterised protein [Salmonella enterica subsp. enterica]|nr:Uncharacterised protein [Salmonella enterica subsp. enterica]